MEDAAASKRAYRGLRRDSSAATECVSALASCGLPPWARRGPPCWLAAQAATPGSRDNWALALRRGYDSYGFKRRKINIRETRSLTPNEGLVGVLVRRGMNAAASSTRHSGEGAGR
jgi:hypothetical protein